MLLRAYLHTYFQSINAALKKKITLASEFTYQFCLIHLTVFFCNIATVILRNEIISLPTQNPPIHFWFAWSKSQ